MGNKKERKQLRGFFHAIWDLLRQSCFGRVNPFFFSACSDIVTAACGSWKPRCFSRDGGRHSHPLGGVALGKLIEFFEQFCPLKSYLSGPNLEPKACRVQAEYISGGYVKNGEGG